MHKLMIGVLTALVGAATGTALGSHDADRAIAVHDPWIRELPPVAENSAAYMRLTNPGDDDRALVASESPQFGRVELHESVDEDGTMRMRHRDRLVVPAGGEASLKPGGYHLMLMGRRVESLKAGDEVELRLHFEDGSEKALTVPVRTEAPDGTEHEH